MPLPADVQSRLRDPGFWRAYLFEPQDEDDDLYDDLDEDDDEDASFVVEFPVGDGYALVLDIDVSIRMVNLALRTPDSDETLELGWDDEAHWHPHALRWVELDLIARAAAALDPGLPHPGPVVALTSRFVVLAATEPGDPDDVGPLDEITRLLDHAYGPPPAGAPWWPSADDLLDRIDGRGNGVVWRRDAVGDWTVDQDETDPAGFALYSTRVPGGEFPFARWRELLAAAAATLT
ncbi:hypothetical protein [Catenuloplanes atrovinosus]|uniref:Uncharacterized protein n=1 Tax=Catenuloplanes atrovinosus TaxID=137266 RepID=A0AAE3YQQ8_9ACTN|nr:hypothetical protein [Catenuloplanes atrovinosus]MDR7276594.1 hypothetical protein [Catenuloplanes atrovinosus]